MTRALTKRRNLPVKNPSGFNWLAIIAVVGLVIWLVTRNKGVAQYQNEERTEVRRNEQGFITEIITRRNAKQS